MLEYLFIGLMVWAAAYLLFLRPRRTREEGGEAVDPVRAATRIKSYYDESAHPRDLLEHRPFVDAAQGLSRSARSDADLLAYANGGNPVVTCMALEALARRVLGRVDATHELTVVRRYREEPSPLVRDGVRRWRTGRADRVFTGDFDLIC